MIRILFVISGLPRGGAETTLVQLLKGLNRNRFDPMVVSLLDEGEVGEDIRSLGVPLLTLNLNHPRWIFHGLFKFVHTVRSWKPHILQGWMYHGNLLAFIGRLIAQKSTPLVFGIHNALSNWKQEKRATRAIILLNSRLSKQSDFILFPSLTSAQQHWALGYDATRSEILSNGIDCEYFSPNHNDRKKFRKELGIAPETLLIGLVARFHPVKDHRGFLDAAKRLADSHQHVQFLLCGSEISPHNGELMALITDRGLKGRVLVIGSRTDMNRVYRSLDLLVLSSISEAFGGVLAEAMASGTPCVATRVGICAEIVGSTGWLAEPSNPEDLFRALLSACESTENNRNDRGANARTRILERYNVDSMVGHYERLFEQLATRP